MLKTVVSTLPKNRKTAYLLIQHLDPDYPTVLDKILSKHASLPIKMIEANTPLLPDTIYICPSDKSCVVKNDKVILQKLGRLPARHSIDVLLESLAQSYGDRAVGIVLSGTGHDGVNGMREIKAAGGWTIAQDPTTAKFASMPQAIIDLHLADLTVSPENIGKLLASTILANDSAASKLPVADSGDEMEELLELLRSKTGFNIYRYNSAMLLRRINRRMAANGAKDMKQYRDLVESSSSEAGVLIKDLFITVTGFFRDRQVFDAVAKLLHNLVKAKHKHDSLRVWVAGCASGEEAYSIAILLAEELQLLKKPLKIHIFATDVDNNNISIARKGIYSAQVVQNIPKSLLDKYFIKLNGQFQVNTVIRDLLVFAQHDLLADPPFSNLDFLCCRNVLIYFNKDSKRKLIESFHYALKAGGYLLIGSSESTGRGDKLFKPIDRKLKLYQQIGEQNILPSIEHSNSTTKIAKPDTTVSKQASLEQEIYRAFFEECAPPAILLNDRFEILHISGDVNPYIKIPQGVMKANLLDMALPELRLEMRKLMQTARRNATIVRGSKITLKPEAAKSKESARRQTLTLVAIPFDDQSKHGAENILLLFEAGSEPNTELPSTSEDEQTLALEQELAASRDQLQSNYASLESANNELQSLSDEFLATSEELQSSNEELQSTNEELQSSNEELISVNEELRNLTDELTQTNAELQSILDTSLAGTILLNRDLAITRYSASCSEIFELLPEQENQYQLLMTKLGSVAELAEKMHKALDSGLAQQYQINLQEKFFLVKIFPVRDTSSDQIANLVIAFYDESERLQQEQDARLLAAIVKDSNDSIFVQDIDGKILHWNHGSQKMYGYDENEALAMNVTVLIPAGLREDYQQYIDELIEQDKENYESREIQRITRSGAQINVWLTATLLRNHQGEPEYIAITEHNITDQKRDAERLRTIFESSPDAMIITDSDGLLTQSNAQAAELFGYSSTELHKLSLEILIPTRYREQHRKQHSKFLSNPTPRQMGAGLELYCLNKAGREIPVEISLSPIIVAGETTTMVRVRDVTEQLRHQKILKAAKEDAEQANRAKSRFLAAASHDLRQPLQSISMYLGALSAKTSAKDRKAIIEQTKISLFTINRLLNALLDISKLESGMVQPEIVDFKLEEVMRRVYNTEAPQAEEKNQNISIVHCSRSVRTDSTLLEIVLTNIVANAIRYTPKNGRIVIGCRRRKNFVEIQVCDTGIGIPGDEIENIFDEYVQLEYFGQRSSKGLGLGLAIVKRITELLNLELTVTSKVNQGTTFSLLLPLAKQATNSNPNPDDKPGEGKPNTALILLVEDDSAVLKSTQLFLQLSGFRVLSARNATEAREKFLNSKEQPEIIVSDYGLRDGENGLQIISDIRDISRRDLPAILMTGDTSSERSQQAEQAHCKIIFKPIDSSSLLQSIDEALKGE